MTDSKNLFKDISNDDEGIPTSSLLFLFAVVTASILPLILNLSGVDFGVTKTINLVSHYISPSQFLEGRLIISLSEVAAITLALIACIFCYQQFATKIEAGTAIMGIALLCSGIFDVFYLNVLNGFIASSNSVLISEYVWHLGRFFNAILIPVLGILILSNNWISCAKGHKPIYITATIFSIITLGIIASTIAADKANLIKQEGTPASDMIFDAVPIIFQLISAAIILNLLYRRHPNIFTYSLWLAILPSIMCQLHDAWSMQLYDSNYMLSRVAKLVSYLVPLVGLTLNYTYLFRKEMRLAAALDNEIAEKTRTQQYLQGVFDSSHDAIFVLYPLKGLNDLIQDFKITNFNRTAEKLPFIILWPIGNNDLTKVIAPVVSDHIFTKCLSVIDKNERSVTEFQYKAQSNREGRYYTASITKMGFGVVVTLTDITEKKQAEIELIESQLFSKTLADHTPTLVYLYDINTQQTHYFNRELSNLLGYSQAELKFMRNGWQRQIVHPDDFVNNGMHTAALRNLEDGKTIESEFRIKDKKGQYYTVIARETVFKRSKDGQVTEVLGSAQNISDRKKYEAELLEKEQKFSALFHEAFQCTALLDTQGNVIDANESCKTLLGTSGKELDGCNIHHFLGIDTAAGSSFKLMLADALKGILQRATITVESNQLILDVTLKPVGNAINGIQSILFEARDITAYVNEQRRVIASEAAMADAQKIAGIGTYDWNMETGALYWSDAIYAMVGRNPVDGPVTQENYLSHIMAEDRAGTAEALGKAELNNDTADIKFRVITLQNEIRWLQTRCRITKNEAGKRIRITGVTRDITEETQNHEAIEAQRQLYLSLAQNIPESMVIITDAEGVCQIAEGTIMSAFKLARTDCPGKNIRNILVDAIEEANFTTWLLPDHKITQTHFFTFKGLDYNLTMVPIAQDAEVPNSKYMFLVRDITERRDFQRQLETKIKELARSNEELAQFANIASHDLQEPLRKIRSLTDRLVEEYAPVLPDDGAEYLRRVVNATDRMTNLINDLLQYSRVRKDNQLLKVISLNKVIDAVTSDMEYSIHTQEAIINVTTLPSIIADKGQMGQMFQNLLTNALKFSKPNVIPEVNINYHQITQTDYPDLDFSASSSWLQIDVEDNGIGFDQKYADKIFTLFQRLHGRIAYEGTGIGLAIVKKVVENHAGYILVSSTLDIGSKFSILLPVFN